MTRAEAARISSAGCQPNWAIMAWPRGEKTTWPKEPAAVPSPSARERRSGPTTLAIDARAMEKAVKATPRPVSTPPKTCSARSLSASAMPQTPAA